MGNSMILKWGLYADGLTVNKSSACGMEFAFQWRNGVYTPDNYVKCVRVYGLYAVDYFKGIVTITLLPVPRYWKSRQILVMTIPRP